MVKKRGPSTEPGLTGAGVKLDELFPVGEVRLEPGESCAS